MLKIENQIDRSKLKKYFYINSSGWLDTVFWISLLLFWTGIGAVVCLICGVIKFAGVFKAGASSAEKLYDEVRKADVQYFRNRAVQVMGLVDEEMSLIDPIVASGFADEDAIKYGKEVSANDTKRNFLKIIFDFLHFILFSNHPTIQLGRLTNVNYPYCVRYEIVVKCN